MGLAESLSVTLSLNAQDFMKGLTAAGRSAMGFTRTVSGLGRHFKRGMIDPMKKMSRVGVSSFKAVGKGIASTVQFAGSLSLAVGGVSSAFRALAGMASSIVAQISPIPEVFDRIGEALTARSMVKAASDFAEIQSKFRVVFGTGAFGRAEDIQRWAKSYGKAVGRAQTDLLGFLATLQDTFVPMGFSRNQAADLAKEMTKLAVDVASFNNAADVDVLRDFQSALVGNHETVRKYGIVITQAVLNQQLLAAGIQAGVKGATEQQKVMARLQIIMQGTTDAQGDAIRTADSFANTMKRLTAGVADLSVEFGQRLTAAVSNAIQKMGGVQRIQNLLRPIFELVADLSIQFIAWGQNAIIWVGAVVDRLGGVKKAQDEIRKWVESAGKTVREWFGGLAGDAGSFAETLKKLPAKLSDLVGTVRRVSLSVVKMARAFGDVAAKVTELIGTLPRLLGLLGAFVGGKAGAATGGAVAGPVGAVVGGVTGAVAVGVAGYAAGGGFDTPTPRPRRRGVYFPAARRGFATGGLVTGAPGPDAIHARLTAGEFVMPAAATRGNFELLQAIRAGQQPSGATVNVGPITVGAGASRMDVERDLLPAIERAVRRGVSRGRP